MPPTLRSGSSISRFESGAAGHDEPDSVPEFRALCPRPIRDSARNHAIQAEGLRREIQVVGTGVPGRRRVAGTKG